MVTAMSGRAARTWMLIATLVAGLGVGVLAFTIGVACDSNPTPHPAYQGDDATIVDTSAGGGSETASPGFDNETDPDLADVMTPTDKGDVVDGDADGVSDSLDAVDALDADHNETIAADGR